MISASRPGLGRSGRRVSLDDEELGVGPVVAAVGQLVGHAVVAEIGRLAAGFELLLGEHPVEYGLGHLVFECVDLHLLAAAAGPVGEAGLDGLVDDLLRGRRSEFLLGLALELRLGERDLDRSDEALLHVGRRGLVVAVLRQLLQLLGIGDEDVVGDIGEGPFEPLARGCRPRRSGWC